MRCFAYFIQLQVHGSVQKPILSKLFRGNLRTFYVLHCFESQKIEVYLFQDALSHFPAFVARTEYLTTTILRYVTVAMSSRPLHLVQNLSAGRISVRVMIIACCSCLLNLLQLPRFSKIVSALSSKPDSLNLV